MSINRWEKKFIKNPATEFNEDDTHEKQRGWHLKKAEELELQQKPNRSTLKRLQGMEYRKPLTRSRNVRSPVWIGREYKLSLLK